EEEGPPAEGPYLVAASKNGQILRTTIEGFSEPSIRTGRLVMRLDASDEVLGVELAAGDENVCLASRESYVLIFPCHQISLVKGAAKGVRAMRLSSTDHLIGFTLSSAARDGLVVETNRGRREIVRTTKFEISNRGNRGRQIIRRGHLVRVLREPVEVRLSTR
ncbi:MAG: DNA gyrase C-terminal beta-propeller domain-containing protein, partial [Rhodothermales bacterium]